MTRRSWKFAVSATLCAALPLTVPAPAAAHGRAGNAVVTQWNSIAVRTIFTENNTPIPSSGLYFGFVSLAVYDAVVAIEGRYRPYLRQPRVDRRASVEAAAATAAHDVLAHYFPGSAPALATDLAAALAAIPDGSRKTEGRQAGATAAASLIRVRADDGRNAPILFTKPPGPGVWRPTPPANAPMAVPWLGFVRPLTLRAPTQPWLRGSAPLTSVTYRKELAEARAWGSATSTVRSEAQTATALFYNANAIMQYQVALRDAVTARGWDAVRAARAFAMLSTTTADAQIRCWRAKYDDGFWRPITAIREGAVDPDPSWTSLAAAPPYPDYTSGHACVTGATTSTFATLFGPRTLNVTVPSLSTAPARHYDSAAALEREAFDARIWLGFHFRRAMEDGNYIGHYTARWVQAGWFQRSAVSAEG
ncbi:vanadium-dependent haloperoxidase [Actinoplanes sp. NPDC051633]|uniref:vanadium-dependent haloperoxidase n=1 Tax=Actinoplanes sp. NPDC051633 TaxID=3155670 RepID=UPI0034451460